MRVTPIQKSVFSNRQRSQTWTRQSSDNSVLEKGLTYIKSYGNMSSNIEKERKNDYSDPEKF